MEQIAFFQTEYVGEIAAGMGAFVIILLVTALHRIRRIEKYMQGITGNPVRSEENTIGQAVVPAESADADGWQKMKLAESADADGLQKMKPTESANAEGLQEASCPSVPKLPRDGIRCGEGMQGQNAPQPQSPGALIDEVLGEVFL